MPAVPGGAARGAVAALAQYCESLGARRAPVVDQPLLRACASKSLSEFIGPSGRRSATDMRPVLAALAQGNVPHADDVGPAQRWSRVLARFVFAHAAS